jgi:hypothetical protein
MKCFYNPEEDAIGTCKSCGRGLSLPFASEYPKGLACKNRCEADVESLIRLIDRNVAIQNPSRSLARTGPSNFYGACLFYLVAGAIFIWAGLRTQGGMNPGLFLGVAFIGFGLFTLYRGTRLARFVKETEEDGSRNR